MLLICHYCATRSAMQGLQQLVRLCQLPPHTGDPHGGLQVQGCPWVTVPPHKSQGVDV